MVKIDPDAFLEWERKIELVFDCQNLSEMKKVRLAAAEFVGYAINWYDQVVTHRRRNGGPPISTWDELSALMRRRLFQNIATGNSTNDSDVYFKEPNPWRTITKRWRF